MQDKHQKLDALAKQQQEFDKKRKMLAQDAFVAKLKLKHEQERQMLLLKQGKKVQTSEHMLSALKVPTPPPPHHHPNHTAQDPLRETSRALTCMPRLPSSLSRGTLHSR